MKKLIVIMIGIAACLMACNNTSKQEEPPAAQQPAPAVETKKEVNVRVETQPQPGVKEVKVDPSGVQIKSQTKNGTQVEVDTRDKPH